MYQIGPFQYNFKNISSSDMAAKKIFCKETLKIFERELVIVTGPSGGGKSTFLKILKGIIPEHSSGHLEGSVLYKNNPLGGSFFEKNLKDILFLFQNPFSQLIFPRAAEEFFFSMENFNYTREQMDQKKIELQGTFDLENLWFKKTSELSHGECQRLVLASLIAIDPEILLMDEPTAFLDPEARQVFYSWLKKFKGQRTIVIVDHHLDEILPFADKIIHVDQWGEVTAPAQMPPVEVSPQMKFAMPLKTDDLIELHLRDLTFNYSGQESRLLQGLSLSAKSGQIIVIKGKNGKGKSTLFKIMAGLLKPLKGSVEVLKNGKNVAAKKYFQEMGFIFQNPESHFFYDTIKEELKNFDEQNLASLLDVFFKDIDISRSPFLLSEGEKRRLSILMTAFSDKNILFYDEPTFGQDPASINLIKNMLLQLKEMGKLQFIISHDDQFIHSLDADVYELVAKNLVKIK